MATVLLWAAAALVVYTYVGYPLLLWLWTRRTRPPTPPTLNEADLPRVSVIVAAHDEEAFIVDKLTNCAAIDYPPDRIEFLIGSDGSRDATEALVRVHAGPNMRLLTYAEWHGKAAVINDLVATARGEIVVFTDANTQLEEAAIRRLAAHFADPRVGGVGGHLVLAPAGPPGTKPGPTNRFIGGMRRPSRPWKGSWALGRRPPGVADSPARPGEPPAHPTGHLSRYVFDRQGAAARLRRDLCADGRRPRDCGGPNAGRIAP